MLRLVHGMDMNPAAAFVVDPDTQHLYAAYGRGNISQMERQKLMAGTCAGQQGPPRGSWLKFVRSYDALFHFFMAKSFPEATTGHYVLYCLGPYFFPCNQSSICESYVGLSTT